MTHPDLAIGSTVRFRDCDPLGHVNNAVYLTYLEQARFTLWRAADWTSSLVRHRRAGGAARAFILARAEIDFRAQARYGDELEVRLSLASIGRSSFTYDVRDRAPAGRATSSPARKHRAGVVRLRRERPVPLSDEMKRQLAVPIGG